MTGQFRVAVGSARKLRDSWPALALGVAGFAYVVIHLAALGQQSYWLDELISVREANASFILMLKLQAGDIHPPLYGTVLWAWVRATHDATEATVRLVNLVAVAIGIVILGIATWRRAGLGAAIVFATLAFGSTLVLSFALEARPHGLAFSLICVATAAWWFTLERPPLRRVPLLVFLVAGGLASITQYYGALVFAIEAAVLLGWLVWRGRRREAMTRLVLIALAMAPVAAWFLVTRRLLQPSSTPSLTLSWAAEVAGWATEPWATAMFGATAEQWGGLILLAAAIAIGVVALLLGWRQRSPFAAQGARGTTVPLTIGAATLSVAVAATIVASLESVLLLPTLHYRSVMSIMPALLAGLAVAVTVPFRARANVAGPFIAIGLLAVAMATPQPLRYTKDQFREAATIVRSQREAGLPADRIAVVQRWDTGEWTVALNNAYGRPAPDTDLPPELAGLTWISQPTDVTAMAADQPMLLVAFHYWTWDLHQSIVDATQARFGPCRDRSVTGITILDCRGT